MIQPPLRTRAPSSHGMQRRFQRQNGTLSQIQFMQQELAYLQAQSGFKCADLNLQQALRNYQWAVKGVSVSAG